MEFTLIEEAGVKVVEGQPDVSLMSSADDVDCVLEVDVGRVGEPTRQVADFPGRNHAFSENGERLWGDPVGVTTRRARKIVVRGSQVIWLFIALAMDLQKWVLHYHSLPCALSYCRVENWSPKLQLSA